MKIKFYFFHHIESKFFYLTGGQKEPSQKGPKIELKGLFEKYVDAELVWAQEEPRNMGAYGHLLLHLPQARNFRVASRRFYGAPAAGSSTRSKRRHQEIIEYVFDKTKDNMR